MDSEATIKLMEGDIDEDNLWGALIKDGKALTLNFARTKFIHTWSEGNKCADWFANLSQVGD